MLGKEQWRQIFGLAATELRKLLLDNGLQIKLFLEPDGHRGDEGLKPPGCVAQVSLEQSLELDERLVVEDDPVDVAKTQVFRFQAITDGVFGKARVMLLAAEAFLLRRGHQFAVLQQGGSTVMVVSRNAENAGRLRGYCSAACAHSLASAG